MRHVEVLLASRSWNAETFGPVVSQPVRIASSSSSISSSPIDGRLRPRWISRRVRWCIAFSVTGDVARYFLAIGVPRLIFATLAAALSFTAVAGAAVITGTANNDAIFGTAGNDTIESLAGDDAVLGQAGRRLVYGGRGDDFIAGDGACPQVNRPFYCIRRLPGRPATTACSAVAATTSSTATPATTGSAAGAAPTRSPAGRGTTASIRAGAGTPYGRGKATTRSSAAATMRDRINCGAGFRHRLRRIAATG